MNREVYKLRSAAMDRLRELHKLGFKATLHSEGTNLIIEFCKK